MEQDHGRRVSSRRRTATQVIRESSDANIRINYGRHFASDLNIHDPNNDDNIPAFEGGHGEEENERVAGRDDASSQDNSVIESETSDNDENFPAFGGDHNVEEMESAASEEVEAAVVDDTEDQVNSGARVEEGAETAASEGGGEVSVLLDRLSISCNKGESDEDNNNNNSESDEDNNNSESDEDNNNSGSDEDNNNSGSDEDNSNSESDEDNNNSGSDENNSNSESDEDNSNSESDEENDFVCRCRYCHVAIPPLRAALLPLLRRNDDPHANRYFRRHFTAVHNDNGAQYHCMPWGTLSTTIIFNPMTNTLRDLEAAVLGLNEQHACELIEFIAIARSFLLQPRRHIIEEIGFPPDGNMQRNVLVADYIRIWQEIINNDIDEVQRTVTNRYTNMMTEHLNRQNWEGNVQDRLNQLLIDVESTDPLTEEALEASINGAFDFAPSSVLPERFRNTMNKTIFHRLNDIVVLVNRLHDD